MRSILWIDRICIVAADLRDLNFHQMADKFQDSLSNGAHKLLSSFCGSFEGTARTWFDGPDPVDTSTVKGTVRSTLGGRFIIHEYEGTFQGKPLTGMAIIGKYLGQDKWQIAWIDSFHNGTRIMLSEGRSPSEKPDVYGNYPADVGADWGWRTMIEAPSGDQLLVTHFNITPDGQEVKAVEFDYRRIG